MKQLDTGDVVGKVTDGVFSVGKLLVGVLRDRRVPQRNKIVAGGIAAYLLLPFDFIPDFIPGLGQLDDLVMLGVAFDSLLNRVPEEVVQDHWEGDPDLLDFLRGAAATVTNFVPERVRDVLLPDEPY
jgi:uncharacterized membrane protein YkvA (DUF1232 family)